MKPEHFDKLLESVKEADVIILRERLKEATGLLAEVAHTGLLRRARIDANLSARVSKFLAAQSTGHCTADSAHA